MKRRKMKNKKGFTLIELLAVIIILGVLMIIAIPSVTEYIQSTRKSAYITTAKGYINGARIKVNSSQLPFYDVDATYYVPSKCIALEKGGDSPYGEFEQAYVVVSYTGDSYNYYWASRDTANMGVELVSEHELDEEDVKPGMSTLDTTLTVEGKSKIILLNDDCTVGQVFSDDGTMLAILKKNAVPDIGVDFSAAASKSGNFVMSETQNYSMPIYYFRGNVTNNNVLFNNFCWKIVRNTEDGGVKLIYNGTPSGTSCNGTNSVINGGIAYSSSASDNSNLIYANSTLKTYIENWYETNMSNVTDKLEDTKWCNDRSIPEKYVLYGNEQTNGTGIGNSLTYYGSYVRLVKNGNTTKGSTPSLKCNDSDVYSVANGKLKHPIALITADEAVIAGNPWEVGNNGYLSNGTAFWTMSPNNFNYGGAYMLNVAASGDLDYYGGYTANGYSLRPAITIKSGTRIADGDGTASNPYIIEE